MNPSSNIIETSRIAPNPAYGVSEEFWSDSDSAGYESTTHHDFLVKPVTQAISALLNTDEILPIQPDHADSNDKKLSQEKLFELQEKLFELREKIVKSFKAIKKNEDDSKHAKRLKSELIIFIQDFIKVSDINLSDYGNKSKLIREFKDDTQVAERTVRHYIDIAMFSIDHDLEITEETLPVIKPVCMIAQEEWKEVWKKIIEKAYPEFPTSKLVNAVIREHKEKRTGKIAGKVSAIKATNNKAKISQTLDIAKLLIVLANDGDEFELRSMSLAGLTEFVEMIEQYQSTEDYKLLE